MRAGGQLPLYQGGYHFVTLCDRSQSIEHVPLMKPTKCYKILRGETLQQWFMFSVHWYNLAVASTLDPDKQLFPASANCSSSMVCISSAFVVVRQTNGSEHRKGNCYLKDIHDFFQIEPLSLLLLDANKSEIRFITVFLCIERKIQNFRLRYTTIQSDTRHQDPRKVYQ